MPCPDVVGREALTRCIASTVVGGQLRLAASVDGREELGGVISHLETQIHKLGVDLRLDWAPTAAELHALGLGHVVIATGSAPGRDIIGNIARGVHTTPGLEQEHVLDVWDVLEHRAEVGDKVLIADDGEGGWKAISLALHLATRGHDVHLSSPCRMSPRRSARSARTD